MSKATVASDLSYITDRSIPEPNSGCWLWTEAMTTAGYGLAYTPGPCSPRGEFALQNRRLIYAHRLSWRLASGVDAGSLRVLHRSDHLFLGTQRDNVRDMVNKGRARGRFSKRGTPNV